jgi:hypothetical protein
LLASMAPVGSALPSGTYLRTSVTGRFPHVRPRPDFAEIRRFSTKLQDGYQTAAHSYRAILAIFAASLNASSRWRLDIR